MKTLKEHLEQNGGKMSHHSAILVSPVKHPLHIFSYIPKISGNYCDVGKSAWWNQEFSSHTGEWIPTSELNVVEGN